VFPDRDERNEKGNYGLEHLAGTLTKQKAFRNILSFSGPIGSTQLSQTTKMNIPKQVIEQQDMMLRQIHKLCFSRIPFESMQHAQGDRKLGKYLHDLINDRRHKILLMGGLTSYYNATNRVDMMVIDDKDGKISWEACAPMIKERCFHSAYYCQGQVLSVSSHRYRADGQAASERYDVFSQTAVELEHMLPIPDLRHVAMAELDGKAFVIGGYYEDAASRQYMFSDRVFCLDNKKHRGQAGTWIEQEARLITPRFGAAAATYQGKVWLAGGLDGNREPLSSIEVFDPLVGSWQAAGDLTKSRYGKIALFAIKDDLFAAKGTNEGMWVEKRNSQTGSWQLVSKINDGDRFYCSMTACGSTIYFIGGSGITTTMNNWNSFDTNTNKWASEEGQYQDVSTRQLPIEFASGQAVCITPEEQLEKLRNLNSLDLVLRQDDEEDA